MPRQATAIPAGLAGRAASAICRILHRELQYPDPGFMIRKVVRLTGRRPILRRLQGDGLGGAIQEQIDATVKDASDREVARFCGYNRRGSKDSQLRWVIRSSARRPPSAP